MNEQNYWAAVKHLQSLDKRFKGNKTVGWVYAFRNPNHKQTAFKIGETSRPPLQRLQELSSSTGVPVAYQAVYFVHVNDRKRAERFVHDQLKEYRLSDSKEFFTAPLREVVRVMDESVKYFPNVLVPQVFEPEVISCGSCRKKNKVKRLGISVRLRCHSCGEYLSL